MDGCGEVRGRQQGKAANRIGCDPKHAKQKTRASIGDSYLYLGKTFCSCSADVV